MSKSPRFNPQFGQQPPFFAGREEILDELSSYVKRLIEEPATGYCVFIYGPRGNGKTVLLRELVSRMQQQHPKLHVYSQPAQLVGIDEASIADWLTKGELVIAKSSTQEDEQKIGSSGTGVTFRRRKESTFRTGSIVAHAVAFATANGPAIIAIDEAQAIPQRLFSQILAAAQEFSTNRPVLFLFLGTPDLPDHAAASATFASRSFNRIGVDILDDEATHDALIRPLEELNIELPEQIRIEALTLTSNYPYFVQLLGIAIEEAYSHQTESSIHNWNNARRAFEVAKRGYYEERARDLGRNPGVRAMCYWIANYFTENHSLSNNQIENAMENLVSDLSEEEQEEVWRRLIHTGFIWKNPHDTNYKPGIPSFMTHYKELGDELGLDRTPTATFLSFDSDSTH